MIQIIFPSFFCICLTSQDKKKSVVNFRTVIMKRQIIINFVIWSLANNQTSGIPTSLEVLNNQLDQFLQHQTLNYHKNFHVLYA